jgi:putative ABC transport system permease protein
MDIRIALRTMARSPTFTLACVVTLAVGIGSTTSIFTVVNSVILRSLPYPESHGLVRLYSNDNEGDGALDNATGADYLDWKAQSTSFSLLAGYVANNFNLTGTEFPIRLRGASVTPEFFSVLGLSAELGRTLSPELDHPGAEPSVVVSNGFWRSHLGTDPKIVGTNLRLNGVTYTVVGVMPAAFAFPSGAVLWTSSPFPVPAPPLDFGDDPAADRGSHYFDVIGRLAEAADVANAQQEMTAIAGRLAREYPETNSGEGVVVRSLTEIVIGDARPRLFLLLATAGFVLMIACINVAGMLVTRASERSREIALRLAIGAERRRIVRQFLTESLVLACIGGVVGVTLAMWGTRTILRSE